MSKKIKKISKSNSDSSGVIRMIGDAGYLVKDTPCLIPKENMPMFNAMRKTAGVSSFGNYPNPFNVFWKGAGK